MSEQGRRRFTIRAARVYIQFLMSKRGRMGAGLRISPARYQ